jgi:hypothetical protein
MSPRLRRGLVAIALLAAAVALLALRRGPERSAAAVAVASARSGEAEARRPGPALAAGGPRAEAVTLARLQQQYEAYRAGSIYPDWSYPLTQDQTFLTEWNATVTDDLPVDDAGRIFFRFDAAQARVFAGEPYLSWMEAWTLDGGAKRRLPIAIERAVVVVTGGPAQGEAFALDYRDDGRDGDAAAGDLRYTNRFVPSARPELARAQQARIEAYVDIGGRRRRFLRDFVWAPRPVLEVVAVSDAMRDGSLAVTLACDVREDGVYTVYANLFAADGATPVATSRRNLPLTAGRRTVDLVFFGKVLADQQIDGPYLVRDIHGLRRQQAEELNVWWRYAGVHRTAAYAADDFSPEEWNDPERRERLASFERAIRDMGGQAGGAP